MVTYSNLMFFQLSILCTEWFLADHTDFFLHSHFRVWKSENKIQLISLEIECCLMFNLPQLLSAQFWKKMYMHLFAHLYTLACHFAFSSNLETDVTCLIDWADLVGELEKTNFGIFKLFRDDICIIVSPSPPHWAWETLPQCKGVRLVSKVFPALLRVPNFLVFAKASEAGNLTSVAIDPVTPLVHQSYFCTFECVFKTLSACSGELLKSMTQSWIWRILRNWSNIWLTRWSWRWWTSRRRRSPTRKTDGFHLLLLGGWQDGKDLAWLGGHEDSRRQGGL